MSVSPSRRYIDEPSRKCSRLTVTFSVSSLCSSATKQVMIFVVLAMLRSCVSLRDASTRPLPASIKMNAAAAVSGAAA